MLHPPSPLPLLLLFPFFLLPFSTLSLTQDGLYLLQFKSSLDDPSSALSDWNPRDPTPCNWTGVTCSSSFVTALDLPYLNLAGPFPPVLCSRLTRLSRLSLPGNILNATLPSSSLLPCPSLSHLDLSGNLLVGPLPDSLHLLPSLLHLDLSANNFSGPIPPTFAFLPRLQNLSLVNNLLDGGALPSFLANVTTLRQLNLSYNPFLPGPIPAAYGNLSDLDTLWLTQCNLAGPIPSSLGRLKSLRNLDLSYNALEGTIPDSLSMLTGAFQIELYGNSLYGEIPPGLSNLTGLLNFDASMNQLVGTIPPGLFKLPLLESLNLYQNRLVGEIPPEAAEAARLSELRLFDNQLTGSIPRGLGKNSPLLIVDLSQNLLSGEIPPGICDMGSLQELMLIDNMLSGTLPTGLGRCRSLFRLRLSNNLLSGDVPAGLWGLPHVYLIDLARNSFTGTISPSISQGANISSILISDNRFAGPIPEGVGALSKLYEFSAGNNRLSGPLPGALKSLKNLGKVDLHNNSLSGELLTGISSSWTNLADLNLASNGFTGTIPAELGNLPVLNYLDLSNNQLTGEVPAELQNLTLNKFNFSNNQLSGKLPPLLATQTFRTSFLGNPGLCDDLPGLCPQTQTGTPRSRTYIWTLRSLFILAGVVFVVGVLCFYLRYRRFKKAKQEMEKSKWTLTSFHKLGFSEYEILDCLDEDNVIGSGASGKVYKAVLSNGEAVAVKKLWGTSAKMDEESHDSSQDSFDAEVATLGKIRHKNIVRLWCCCTHRDCKLLVYEYMPNGSLGDLLHGSKGGMLDWPTRYKIAMDAAGGLSYLHHDCVPPIVHRDVKSNNILLDADFGARVADFGVAKVVDAAAGKGGANRSMSVIAGSCGYIAPEYAYTLRVNEKSDVYSFGVVLLELVTGKQPVDPEFGEKDVVKWVCSTLEQKGVDHVLDPKLDPCFRVEVCKVLDIGLQCTSSLPINRPSMRRVVKMLMDVGAERWPKQQEKSEGGKKDGKLSPYYYEDSSDLGSVV